MKKLFLLFTILLFATQAWAVDVVIKTGNLTTFDARAKQFGIVVRDADHEIPFTRIEGKYEIINTPILEDINGDLYFTIRLTEEQADKLPKNDTPNFSIEYDSRETCGTVEEPTQCLWPVVIVARPEYDANGDPTGGVVYSEQGVGRIQ